MVTSYFTVFFRYFSHSRRRLSQGSRCRPPNLSFITLAILFVGVDAVSSLAWAGWPNEPAGSSVVADCGFDGNLCNFLDSYRSISSYVGGGPESPSRAVDIYLGVNATHGSGQFEMGLPNPREVYVGFTWSTNAGFQGLSVLTNKMFFLTGANFLMWQGQPGQLGTLKWYQQHLLNNCHVSGWVGDCNPTGSGQAGWYEPNMGNAYVAPGSGWHRVEVYVKASSSETSRDGVVRWWLDGRLVGNYTNINQSPQGFYDFTWTNTWDGSGALQCSVRNCAYDWHHYIDHFKISIPNGGNIPIPMPQPQPQPQPQPVPQPQPSVPNPGTVSDLAVSSTDSSSVSLSFTEVDDGTGAPAKYDLRYGPAGSYWGAMSSVSSGACASPIAGTQIGAKKSCTIAGLAASTQYQFQVVAVRGTPNQGATYGGLSSVVNVATQSGSTSPQPQPVGPEISALSVDNTGANISWLSIADRLTYSSDNLTETTVATLTSGQRGFRHTISRPAGTTYVCYRLYVGAIGGEPQCKSAQATVTTSPQPQPGSTSDQSAPLVSFVFPTSGSNVSNSILALAQAVDDTAVSEVRFYVDGLQIGLELRAAPYMLLIDTAKLSNGTHQLSAVAKDIAGNTSSAAKIALNVSNVAGSYTTDPLTAAAGCVMGQTKTNQVNASMGLIWLLPMIGLARRRKR